jgi:hypothetical protein
VAGVFDRNSATVYVNGEPAGHATLPFRILRDPKETMQIGADLMTPVDPVAGQGSFRGLIDSVGVHNHALAAEELEKLAN